jgi:drug/metabolite transporter (DMT)-like permease
MSPKGIDASPNAASRALGFVAISGAALTWSLGAIASSVLFFEGMEPTQLAVARVVLTAFGLSLVWIPTRKARGRLPIHLLLLLGLAAAAINISFFLVIERLNVAVGTVLHYMAPVLIAVWSLLFSPHRPEFFVLASTVAAVVGVMLVSEVLAVGLASVDFIGLLLGLMSATFFAIYTVLSGRAVAVYGSLGALVRAFGIAAVCWIVWQASQGWPAQAGDARYLGWVMFVAFGGTCLPFLLFIWGTRRVGPQRASVAATLEPAISGVIAWTVLGQTLSSWQITGGLIILGAVLALQFHDSAVPGVRKSAAPTAVGENSI